MCSSDLMGIAVFSGMLGVTGFGLFLTPLFYVLVRKFWARKRANSSTTTPTLLEHPSFSDGTG